MASHVYPYVFSFKNIKGKKDTSVVLLETTRTRSKDWIIQAKDGWDNDWKTVVNVSRQFKDFLDKSIYENKTVANAGGKERKIYREAMGGHLGYSHGTFFWNIMRWALVKALSEQLVYVMEDEWYALPDKITDSIVNLPDPTAVPGIPNEAFLWAGSEFNWQYEGSNYSFDYLAELETRLKRINFNIVTSF